MIYSPEKQQMGGKRGMNKGGNGEGQVAFRVSHCIPFFSFLPLYFSLVLASKIIAFLIGIDCHHIKVTYSLALTCPSKLTKSDRGLCV